MTRLYILAEPDRQGHIGLYFRNHIQRLILGLLVTGQTPHMRGLSWVLGVLRLAPRWVLNWDHSGLNRVQGGHYWVPSYIQHKNCIINLTHLKMEYWKNSFRSWTLYQSFNLLMDQNYKNVKNTFQVGLHWVQGGHYWVTWYSMEWTLNKQVLYMIS